MGSRRENGCSLWGMNLDGAPWDPQRRLAVCQQSAGTSPSGASSSGKGDQAFCLALPATGGPCSFHCPGAPSSLALKLLSCGAGLSTSDLRFLTELCRCLSGCPVHREWPFPACYHMYRSHNNPHSHLLWFCFSETLNSLGASHYWIGKRGAWGHLGFRMAYTWHSPVLWLRSEERLIM